MASTGILGKADYFSDAGKNTYVRITDDKMQAWLYLAPKAGSEPYARDEILRLLVENGVLYGFDQSIIVAVAKKGIYHREILVASGAEPQKGSDGYFEYTFDIQSGKSKPVIREDGSVDYQSMRAVNSVQAGSLLATYYHAVPGVSGKDVCGNEITVPMVRELPTICGRGVYQGIDDPDKYYAEKDGKIEVSGGKLNIVNVLEFSGDVDQLTGKLEFYGDIHIQGNVEAGTIIRAGKSLTIDGIVEAADLFAGGDIILKRGIQGSQKAHIVGRGNLYADFIEHTYVKLEGDVEANYILSSYISALGKVKLSGKKASIVGGSVYARKGITCNFAGNDVEIKTRLAAGVSQEMIDENEKLQRQMKTVRDEVQRIKSTIVSMGSHLPPEKLQEYKVRLQQLMTEQKSIMDQQKVIFDKMEEGKDATIYVGDTIYLGCEICIDEHNLKLDKKNATVEYRNISGMITGKTVAYK